LAQISKVPAAKRAARFRERAHQARVQAAHCKGEAQESYIKIAGQWEQLAREADAEAEREK
jgi:hypothetical protein